jgi:hypothetical protein
MHVIDYHKIARAIEFYKMLGYEYIEVPWMVSTASIDITKPPNATRFDTWRGSLVASGEQSFLEIRDNLCPGRKYQCATPCFRDEKVVDDLHLPQFFKVELIVPLWKHDDAEPYFKQIVMDGLKFARHYNSSGNAVTWADTDIGQDILVEGIEIGSYGVREHEGFRWVYGTGIAEPRFTQAMEAHAKRTELELEELCK